MVHERNDMNVNVTSNAIRKITVEPIRLGIRTKSNGDLEVYDVVSGRIVEAILDISVDSALEEAVKLRLSCFAHMPNGQILASV